jgi:hypothetical protein
MTSNWILFLADLRPMKRGAFFWHISCEVNKYRKDKMMKITLISTLLVFLLMLSCDREERIVEVPVYINYEPAPPSCVWAINLDGYVRIFWTPVLEPDIYKYEVYRAPEYEGPFEKIGDVVAEYPNPYEYYYDYTLPNGEQYYYAVRAFDTGGLNSEYSYDEITATPRPERFDSLYEHDYFPDGSGIDFYDEGGVAGTKQRDSSATPDLFFAYEEDEHGKTTYQLVAYRNGVDIQDVGYVGPTVYDYDFKNVAPELGWSSTGIVEAIAGHCYMLRLLENDGYHYMKLIIAPEIESRDPLTQEKVLFWWAFQTDPGNRDLAPPPGEDEERDECAKTLEIQVGRLYPPSLREGSNGTEKHL